MTSIDQRPNGMWRARWREYPGGPQRTKSFSRKRDARRFLDGVGGDLVRGLYIDPSVGQVTFREVAEEWPRLQPHRASTATNVEQDLGLHVYPVLGDRPIASIRASHVQAMVTAAAATLKPSTMHRVYGRVSSVFRSAVRDRIVAASPCIDVRLPRTGAAAVSDVLTTAQVLDLAATVPDRYRALILTAAGTGLRPGELFGLTVDRIEFLRRTLKVDQQMARVRGSGVMLAALKTPSSYRTVPLPTTVAEVLAAHLATWPAHPEGGLVFVNGRGGAIQQQPFASLFETARKRAGVPEWRPLTTCVTTTPRC